MSNERLAKLATARVVLLLRKSCTVAKSTDTSSEVRALTLAVCSQVTREDGEDVASRCSYVLTHLISFSVQPRWAHVGLKKAALLGERPYSWELKT